MHNYLSSAIADYNYDLVLRNQNVMPQAGDKKQIVHEFDDGSLSVTRMSDASLFEVTVQFTVVTIADSATILDLWHNENKANGRERTFYWQHPNSLRYYTVRFLDVVTMQYRTDYGTSYLEVEGFKLKIEGNKP